MVSCIYKGIPNSFKKYKILVLYRFLVRFYGQGQFMWKSWYDYADYDHQHLGYHSNRFCLLYDQTIIFTKKTVDKLCFEIKKCVGNAFASNLEIQIYWLSQQQKTQSLGKKNDCRQKCFGKSLGWTLDPSMEDVNR